MRAWPAILLLLAFQNGTAQVRFGNRAGMNVGTQAFEKASAYTGPTVYGDLNARPLGVSGALTIHVPVNDHLGIQAELGYTEKGFRTPQESQYRNSLLYDQMDRIGYLDLWTLVAFSPGYGTVRLEVLAGPVFARSMQLRQNYSLIYSSPEGAWPPVQRWTLLAPWEVSLCGGAGVVFQPGITELHLGYRYLHGLTGVYETTVAFTDVNGSPLGTGNLFNRSHLISLGWSLPLSREAWNEARPKP